MLVILDNGHGVNTPGKCSPKLSDGRKFYEWEFNRKVVKRIAELCHEAGIRYLVLVPEDEDISLKERVTRINAIKDNPASNPSIPSTKFEEFAPAINKKINNNE